MRVLELDYTTGKVPLDQETHINSIISQFQLTKIHSYNSSKWWKKWNNTNTPTFDMIMLANEEWSTLTNLCNKVNNVSGDLVPGGILFLAINKYLLLPEYFDLSLPDDYDLAIKDCVCHLLDQYQLVDYVYRQTEQGDIGNFIIPDNRLVLCKKN